MAVFQECAPDGVESDYIWSPCGAACSAYVTAFEPLHQALYSQDGATDVADIDTHLARVKASYTSGHSGLTSENMSEKVFYILHFNFNFNKTLQLYI